MLSKEREWFKVDGASSEAIEKLKAICGIQLPTEYLDLLRYSNGGEGPIPVNPFNFCLDSAETVTNNLTEKTFEEFFPGFLVIGGSGGGELIALDLRNLTKKQVVALDATNSDIDESRMLIAETFTDFLDLIGKEEA